MQTHRQIAKRKTLLWQGAAAVLVAGAVAGAVLPSVARSFAPPAASKPRVAAVDGPKPSSSQGSLPLTDAAQVMVSLTSWVRPPPPPVAPIVVDTAPVVAAAPVAPPSTEWAYVGSIITPMSRSALVKVDNMQQIFSVGTEYHETRLVTVEPTFIEIEQGGEKKKIDLASRTQLAPNEQPRKQPAFRQPPAMPPGGGGAPGAPMAMGVSHGGAPAAGVVTAPATFDQQRMAALAARDAAARAQAGAAQQPPPQAQPDFAEVSPEMREEAMKALMQADLPIEARMKYLKNTGLQSGIGMERASEMLQKFGLDPSSDAGRATLDALKQSMSQNNDGGKDKK